MKLLRASPSSTGMGLCFRKGYSWSGKLNQAAIEMIDSGAYDRIRKNWMPSKTCIKTRDPLPVGLTHVRSLCIYTLAAVSGCLLVTLLSCALNYIHHIQRRITSKRQQREEEPEDEGQESQI